MDKIKINIKDALGIIDPQNDFTREDGALYVAGIKSELPNDKIFLRIDKALGSLIFGYIFLTLDQHPADEEHIEYQIFGKHCLAGSEGQRCDKRFAAKNYRWVDEVIPKGMHPAVISLSAGTSPHFPTHLTALRQNGVKRIFLCGWAFTHCVGESAIDYTRQGLEVYIIRDLCRSIGDPENMEQKLKAYGIKIIYSDQLE